MKYLGVVVWKSGVVFDGAISVQRYKSRNPVTKLCAFFCLCVFCLSCKAAFGQQNAKNIARHPIPADRAYFAALNVQPRHTASNKLSSSTNEMTKNQDLRIVSLPTFTRSFTFGGQVFPYTMVGKDPAKGGNTNIPTQYIPLSFFFDEFVDQNGNNIVIDSTVVNRPLAQSPLFNNFQYTTGFTQFEDAVMRAEFFPLFNKNGNNSEGSNNYHVLLGNPQTLIPVNPSFGPSVQIEVPVGSSEVFVDQDGTFFALIDIDFISSQLNTLVQTEPISVEAIPMFIARNAVYFANQNPKFCCIGGFHTAFEANRTNNKIFVQTFTFAAWLDSDVADAIFGDPTIFADIMPISHELGELLNDPFINNITPNYQLPGFPPGACQNVLEVGDVVEETPNPSFPVTLNGFTYHPQTLGLLQWFEGITPSDAINGAYSFPGNNLTSPFMACPTP